MPGSIAKERATNICLKKNNNARKGDVLPGAHSRNEIKRTEASDGVFVCKHPFIPSFSESWHPHEVRGRQVRRLKIKGVARKQGEVDVGHQFFASAIWRRGAEINI